MPYRILVYLHVLGAMGLILALGVEAVAFHQLVRAASADRQRDALGLLRVNRIVGPISALLVLGPGIYMAETVWAAHPTWVNLGYLTFIAFIVLGAAVTGRNTVRLERSLKDRADLQPLAAPLGALGYSLYARLGLLLGVTYAMVVKPQAAGGVFALGVGLALGVIAAFAADRGGSRSRASTGAETSATHA